MSPAATNVTLASGLTLSCAHHGDPGGAPLVLLPGPTDSWRSYEAVFAHLPPSVRAVAVSQRGHGDSDKPASGFRVRDFAGDVVPLLDALGIAQAILVGHSGSCLTARRVAIDHPDRVGGLVLEGAPTTLRGDPALEAFVANVIASLEDPIDPDFARSVLVDTSSRKLAREVVDQFVQELLKVPARVWQEMFGDLLQYDDTAELDRVAAPALLVWGDGDQLVPRAMQDELSARLPAATLLVYEGVGHTPRWEDPPRFASDLAAFVATTA
jgi:non-heme chloroperoxidase